MGGGGGGLGGEVEVRGRDWVRCHLKKKMTRAIIEMPNGEMINFEVTHMTTLEDILKTLNVMDGEVFGERSDKKLTFVDYNLWFPNDKSYIPHIVIVDMKNMTLKDSVKYEFYKSVGF